VSEIEARLYEKAPGGETLCRACPHRCALASGEVGRCAARVNWSGILYASNFEELASLEDGPIEAAPFADFRAGTRALVVGCAGDPLPPELSTFRPAVDPELSRWASTSEVLDIAVAKRVAGVVFAGGEPLLALEHMAEISAAARESKLYTAAVTSGFAAIEAVREAAPLLDAVNVMLLASEASYPLRLGAAGSRATAVAAAEAFRAAGKHLELTAVVVAGEEPATADLDGLVAIARRLGEPVIHVASPAHIEAAAPVKAVKRVHAYLAERLPRALLTGPYRHG